MTKEKFIADLQEQLELASALTADTNIKELEEWDSMGAMVLIAYVNENFGVGLNAQDIKEISTIKSLIEKIGVDKFD
ncbi:acyl carrier protein [Mucilaginibacter sp. dw_454]|uniref:acyl carrier protein n=1 Tax=Mucilaginibacter sp. dw_454 TaxID=2720079 RepID=UPI001BD1C0C1|nr:acyl carrier protein [Mucilaginibacter sp. dw_454]